MSMPLLTQSLSIPKGEFHLTSIKRWFDGLEASGDSLETMSRDDVKEYHRLTLKHLLHYVWENNSFYRDRLQSAGFEPDQPFGLEDYPTIPFLTKDDLRERYKDILTKQKLAHICKSTGTTGTKPSYIGHTMDELYSYYFAPKYPTLMEKVKNQVVANALPYEMSSSALTFHHEFQHLLHCTILPIGKGGAYSEPEIALQFMKDWEAEILVTTPSYAIVLYEHAKALGMDVKEDFTINHIFLTGEGTSHYFRKRIETIWGCKSTILFGSLEAMLIGLECEVQDGFHLADGHLYIEIVDQETLEPLEAGQQGEIVVTTLLREGMPLVRFRTGDIGFIDESGCDCGVNLPKLFLRGRNIEQIIIETGEYSPFHLENILMQVDGVGNWYRFIVKEKQLKVEVEPLDETVDRELLSEQISSSLEFHINTYCDVQVVDKVHRNAGKMKRVWLED
ncbi:phenylacetate--CoA ligase family protein [Rossellomorea sp. LjRoot5]|uniref:phenylacetate--CoA ligase family protein n=1 Tax=Rossellomorea sp. LjRoot5 TaxID=3342331 RepID=UPI003ECE8F81